MPYDLTLSSPTYNASGKYGSSLNGGTGQVADVYVGLTALTLEAWVKTTASGSIQVICGTGSNPWIGMTADGKARATWGMSDINIITTTTINDGVWHHIAFCIATTTTGATLYVDGVLAGSAAGTSSTQGGTFGVRFFGGVGGFGWGGEVDEIALSSVVKYTGTFTPGPIANDQSNLRAVWHLDGDGINSAGLVAPAATLYTLTGPTSGTVGVASSAFTVTANGSLAAPVTVTPAAADGTFSPASVTLTDAARSATFTYTAASAGAKTISTTDSGGLTDPASITYTAAATDTTAPAFASAQVANANPSIILVTMNETLAASVPANSAFTVSGGRTVSGVSISGTVASVTVNTAYANGDTITVAYTQPGANPRLQDAAGNLTATFGAQPVTNNIAAPPSSAYDSTKILFSPGTWDVQSGFAKTINSGAYLKMNFGGSTCALTFDMTGVQAPYPKLTYRLDEFGPWVTVTLAASIVITMPSETSGYANHHLHLRVRSTSEAVSNWNPQACAVKLTGVALAAGKSLGTKPTELPLHGLYFGDSITRGINTVNATGDAVDRSDAGQGWAYLSAQELGAECGIIGFGGQGFTVTGGGSVPVFGTTWNQLYDGVPRSFARVPDYMVINQGTNDPAGNDTTSATTAILNGMIAATPSSTKIIALRPFNGAHNAHWIAAIAACSAPARITYVDTSGWFNTANSTDNLHPNGFENVSNLAPRTANAIRLALAGAPALTNRTVSITLKMDSGTPGQASVLAANLTGLKVSFHDESSPDQTGVARYQSGSESTDANGTVVFTCGSTLAPTASGGTLTVEGPNLQYSGPAAVA